MSGDNVKAHLKTVHKTSRSCLGIGESAMKLESRSDGEKYDVVHQEGGWGGGRVLGTVYKDGTVWRIEGDSSEGPSFPTPGQAAVEVMMRLSISMH